MDDFAGAQTDEFDKDGSGKTEDGRLTMHIKVYGPFKVYFDEMALGISAENETGPFDILPHHHNFITLLKASDLIVHQLDGTDQRIRISGGIMHVKADRVVVFLDV